MDLDALVAQAAVILDEAAKPFVAGHRADSAVQKKGNDFATEVDLAIERQVVEALEAATGIGVHGEEFGGADLNAPLVWVLDPIDGTFNYAAGSPMAAIVLALLGDGEPLAGLTWLPFTGQRYTAVTGGPLYVDGSAHPPLSPAGLSDAIVGVGQLAQLLGVYIFDRTRTRKVLWVTLVLIYRFLTFGTVGFAIYAHLGGASPMLVWSMLALLALGFSMAQLSANAWWSWMADLAPQQVRGRFLGNRQLAATVAVDPHPDGASFADIRPRSELLTGPGAAAPTGVGCAAR